MEKQIEKKACENCIQHRMCVDKFRKAKQDGDVLLIEEEACFADAGDCDFYADKRIYRRQREGKWVKVMNHKECSECGYNAPYKKIKAGYHLQDLSNYCPKCGAKMKGAEDEKAD